MFLYYIKMNIDILYNDNIIGGKSIKKQSKDKKSDIKEKKGSKEKKGDIKEKKGSKEKKCDIKEKKGS